MAARLPPLALSAHFFLTLPVLAGEADITGVEIDCDANRTCRLNVTVQHADEGWEHYADHWRVLTPAGEEIGRRVLLHPHVTEQPFTRSLSDLAIPSTITTIVIEAHDSVHEYGGETMTIDAVFNP